MDLTRTKAGCEKQSGSRGFSLIELLVVIAIISLLLTILIPGLVAVKRQSRIMMVHTDLHSIGVALEGYAVENRGKYPPVRKDCMLGDHINKLPPELSESDYLPQAPNQESWKGAWMEDRFQPGFTYKYQAVGEVIIDRNYISQWQKAGLYIPNGFPYTEDEQRGTWYDDPKKSPVTWIVYSVGPSFDEEWMKEHNYPVPTGTWYDPQKKTGLLTRLRLRKGEHTGTFR